MRKETCCQHYMGYSFRIAARDLLYVSSYRHDSTYHSLCYTSHGALVGTRNSLMGPSRVIDPTTHCTMSRHSTTELHLAPCYLRGSRVEERERNVLFNDTLNTFYLWLYGVRHMVKDHSDSEKGNPLPPHRLLLSINSKGSFICTIPQTR